MRRDSQPRSRFPNEQRVADWVCCREHEQAPRLRRKGVKPPPVALLDAAGERAARLQPEPACELRWRELAKELDEGQWVAARLADDLVADVPVERRGEHRVQHGER